MRRLTSQFATHRARDARCTVQRRAVDGRHGPEWGPPEPVTARFIPRGVSVIVRAEDRWMNVDLAKLIILSDVPQVPVDSRVTIDGDDYEVRESRVLMDNRGRPSVQMLSLS